MEGWQMRIIGKTFILWFNPETHDFKTTDKEKQESKLNNRREYGKVIRLCK